MQTVENIAESNTISFPPILKIIEEVTDNSNYYNSNIAKTKNNKFIVASGKKKFHESFAVSCFFLYICSMNVKMNNRFLVTLQFNK